MDNTSNIIIRKKISAIFPSKTTMQAPPGVLPIAYKTRDLIVSQVANTPPVYSLEFVLFVVVMVLYTGECIWVHNLLTRANRA